MFKIGDFVKIVNYPECPWRDSVINKYGEIVHIQTEFYKIKIDKEYFYCTEPELRLANFCDYYNRIIEND